MKSKQVSYFPSAELWTNFDDLVLGLASRRGVTAVAELGGGANPILSSEAAWKSVPKRVVFDISAEELSKCDGNVEKKMADLCQPISEEYGAYDLVFSKMLCEHIPDAAAFHENCFNLLRPGGWAVHFFPTLFAAPFVVNRILPEVASRWLVRRVQPGRLNDPKRGKFPAYYRWCKGPLNHMLQRYRRIGFEVEEWRGGFGHNYYRRIPPLDAAEKAKTRFLLRNPHPSLTSFATVVLHKPA